MVEQSQVADEQVRPAMAADVAGSKAGPVLTRVSINLPNFITLGRLLAVPLAIWLMIDAQYGVAFWVFAVAGVSDALDGYIAKRFNCQTRLGALLDPVADKALLSSIFVTLGVAGELPSWLVVLVVFRDVMIIGGFLFVVAIGSAQHFGPLLVSKVNTFMQVALAAFVLARLGLGADETVATHILIVLAAMTTAASGFFYLVRWAAASSGARSRSFDGVLTGMSERAYRLLFWVGLLLILVVALGLVQSILLPFAAGFAIAYILAPFVGRMERAGVRRSLASLLVLALFLIGVACIFVLLVPLIQGQIVQLIARVPSLVRTSQDLLGSGILLLQEHLPAEDVSKVRDLIGSKLGEALTWVASLLQSMITSSIAILNIVSLVIVTPIVTFFLLRDWEAMIAIIDSYVPRQSLSTVREQAALVSDTLVGFVHGQALVCLILALYYGIALSAAQLPSGLALGFLIGVLAIIPIVGVTTGFAVAVALAATQYGTWTEVLLVCGIFLFGQLVEANILTPKLVGDRIHLHPVWVIFALFAGGTLFGFLGILIAVPAAAVIGVLIRFALLRYRRSAIYDSQGETLVPPPQPIPLREIGRAP